MYINSRNNTTGLDEPDLDPTKKIRPRIQIYEWTGELPETHVLTKDREAWQKLVREINDAPTNNNGQGKKEKKKYPMASIIIITFFKVQHTFTSLCPSWYLY